MESKVTGMDQLFLPEYEALCYMILRYLLPKELARLRATNRRFEELVNIDDFWQELIARYKVMVRKLVEDGGGAIDQKEWIMLHYFLNHGVMNLGADLDFIPSGELMNLYLQVLHTARTLEGKHLALKGIGASSTQANHTIHCTLCYLNLDRNWRSEPSLSGGPQLTEYLIYGPTSRELYLFSHITISFFREIEHWDQPVYSPKYVRFHFGYSPKQWHSCTPKFAVASDVDQPQSFEFLPFLSWGRFVKLQFFGKTTRDEAVEAPYYVSVESVHLYGLKVLEFTQEKGLLRAHMFHHCESLAPASSIKPLELNDKEVLELVEEFRSRGPDELDPQFLETRVRPLIELGAFQHSKFRGQCIEQPALLEHAVNSEIKLKGVVTFPVLDLLIQILLVKKNKDV